MSSSSSRPKTIDERWVELGDREHILKRPDTQVGSTEFTTEELFVLAPTKTHHTSSPKTNTSPKANVNQSKDTSPKEGSKAKEGSKEAAKAKDGPKEDAKNGPKGGAKDGPKEDAKNGAKGGAKGDAKDGAKGGTKVGAKTKEGTKAKEGETKEGTNEGTKEEGTKEGTKEGVKDGVKDGVKEVVRVKKAKVVVAPVRMVRRMVRYVPALYKIFDEALVNAADQRQRNVGLTKIKVDIDAKSGEITVWNDGESLPIEIHKASGLYVPELVFSRFRTSSNFDDNEERVTGGRNGLGIKCTNLFSVKFTVEVQDSKRKKRYRQTWTKNMGKRTDPKIKEGVDKADYIKVTFTPDFARFSGMTGFDADTLDLFHKRVYDLAATCPKIKIFLNGQRTPIKSFQDYVNAFILPDTGGDDEKQDGDLVRIYEEVGSRWQVCVCASEGGNGFQQMSFVNSVCTSKGGRHVDYVVDQLIEPIREAVKKRSKGSNKSVPIQPAMIKNHLFVFVNAVIVNPRFDSQMKMTLVTDKSKFGSKCELSEKFLKKLAKSRIVQSIVDVAEHKGSKVLNKSDYRKNDKVDKHENAGAGSRERHKCTLILTEGDSAKALAMAGLTVVGRKFYGVFPLKGKPVNVRDASPDAIQKNDEFVAVKKCLGLKNGVVYNDVSQLQYGHVWIMTDADPDGAHIAGLIMNMLEHFWPELFKIPGFVRQFITPEVKVTRGHQVVPFYTKKAYDKWKEQQDAETLKLWQVKWYKGLGTSTSEEGKEYFSDLSKHTIEIKWNGPADHQALELAFRKKMADARKQWLANFQSLNATDEVERIRETGKISVSDFVNKQLILFSMVSNERAIPSIVDGLKPAQRKIMFAAFKRNLIREIKVASLAGYVIEHAAYLHGEKSCEETIVGMAQNYVGSNNCNLLVPSGQFGTRAKSGKDAASARYINTYLHPISRHIFVQDDDPITTHLYDEGQKIEPVHYLPVIPLGLINGTNGIGTGWSTDIPSHNPHTVVRILKTLIQQTTTHRPDPNRPVTDKPDKPDKPGANRPVSAKPNANRPVSAKPDTGCAVSAKPDAGCAVTDVKVKTEGSDVNVKTEGDVKTDVKCDVKVKSEDGVTATLEPWVRGFKGSIVANEKKVGRYWIRGVATICGTTKDGCDVLVTEIPFDRSLNDYTEDLQKMKEKKRITSLVNETTDENIRYLVRLDTAQMKSAESKGGLIPYLKLESTLTTTNLVSFTPLGQIRKYASAYEMLVEFFNFRLPFYQKRKDSMIQSLMQQLNRLSNRMRFILMVIEDKLRIRNVAKDAIFKQLQSHNFPLLILKKNNNKPHEEREETEDKEGDEEVEVADVKNVVDKKKLEHGYNYLLKMPLWSLTLERVQELKGQYDNKEKQLNQVKATKPTDMWLRDLDAFTSAYDKFEALAQEKLKSAKWKEKKPNPSQKQKPTKRSKPLQTTKKHHSSSSSSSSSKKKKPKLLA